MTNLQEVIKSVENLSIQDQTYLFDILKSKLSQQQESQASDNEIQRRELVNRLRGIASNSLFSSDDFAARKQEEIDWEDRNR